MSQYTVCLVSHHVIAYNYMLKYIIDLMFIVFSVDVVLLLL